jgi:hypothetical protein
MADSTEVSTGTTSSAAVREERERPHRPITDPAVTPAVNTRERLSNTAAEICHDAVLIEGAATEKDVCT